MNHNILTFWASPHSDDLKLPRLDWKFQEAFCIAHVPKGAIVWPCRKRCDLNADRGEFPWAMMKYAYSNWTDKNHRMVTENFT